MSVVLGFATSKFGIVASDGRFIGSNGKIIDENFDKTIKFNDNVIAGFAGYSKPCIQMIIELQNLYPLTDMCLEQILETISCRLPQIVDNKSATFLLIGKNMHGNIDAINKLPNGDVKKLQGRTGYRLRVGNFRIIFSFSENILYIEEIDNRGQIYK